MAAVAAEETIKKSHNSGVCCENLFRSTVQLDRLSSPWALAVSACVLAYSLRRRRDVNDDNGDEDLLRCCWRRRNWSDEFVA